jgi:DNA segregation ATPase FtsK/SpoIIIE-like protein
MSTNTLDFLLSDPLLEEVRPYVLEAGKFSVSDVQQKFKVGYRRAINFRDSLITEGILDKVETDGINWLSGSLVLQEKQDDLIMALDKVQAIVGASGVKEFEKLVKIMDIDRKSVMRFVIMAGVKALIQTLGNQR